MASLLEKHIDGFHGSRPESTGDNSSILGNLLGSLLQSADAPPDAGQGQARGTGVLSILGSALKKDAEGLESAAGPVKSVKTTDPITGKPVEVRMRGANYAGHVGADGKVVQNFSDVAHFDEFQNEGERTRRKDVQKDVNEGWKSALNKADLSVEEEQALKPHFGNIRQLTQMIKSLPPDKQKYILEAAQRQTTAQEQLSVASALDKAAETGKIDAATLDKAANMGFKLPAGLWNGSGSLKHGTSLTLSDTQRTALSQSSGQVKSTAESVVKNQDNEFSRAANEAGIGKQYEAYKTSARVLGDKGIKLTDPLLNQSQTIKEVDIAEGNVNRRGAEGRYLIDFKNQNPNTRVGAGAVTQQFLANYKAPEATQVAEGPAQANAPVAPPVQQAGAPAPQPAKTSASGARVPPKPAAPAVGGNPNQGNEGRRSALTTPVADTGGGAAVFYPKPGGRKPPQGAPTNTNLSLDKLLNSIAGQQVPPQKGYAHGGVIRAAGGIGPILPTDPRFKDPALAMMDNTEGLGTKLVKGFAASMGVPPDLAASAGKALLGEDNYNYAQGFKADPYSYLKESLRAKPDVSPYDNMGGYACGGVIRAADGVGPVGTAAVGKVELPEYSASRERSEAMLPPNEVYNAPKVSRPSQIAGLFNPIDYEIQAQRYKRQQAPDLYGAYAPGRSSDIAALGAEEGFHEARHTPIVDNYLRAVDAHQTAASAANQQAQAAYYGQKAGYEQSRQDYEDYLASPEGQQDTELMGGAMTHADFRNNQARQQAAQSNNVYARGGIIRAANGAGPVIPPEMAQATPAFLQQVQAASPVPPPGPAQAGLGQVQNAGQNEQLKAMAADQKMRQSDAGFLDKKEQEWDSAEQKIRHAEEMHALKKWKVLKEAGVDVNYENLLKEAQKIASGKLLLDEVQSNNDQMTQANQGASMEDVIANIRRNNDQNTQVYQKAYNGYSHGGMERGYEAGSMGVIDGPGTTKSDSIPARLSVGEVVLPAEDVLAVGEGNPELGYQRLKDYARSFGSNPKAKMADGGMLTGHHYANGGRVTQRQDISDLDDWDNYY